MKLAEALSKRAELSRRIQELRERIIRNAKHQEGDSPSEDPRELLQEFERASDIFKKLVISINKTNQSIVLEAGTPMIDALAERDTLKQQHSLYKTLAAEATPKQDRYSKSEIKFVSSVNVADIQGMADNIAQSYRKLDAEIQQANWLNDLIE